MSRLTGVAAGPWASNVRRKVYLVSFVESVSLCVFGLSGMILRPGPPPRILGGSRVAALSAAKLHQCVAENSTAERSELVAREGLCEVVCYVLVGGYVCHPDNAVTDQFTHPEVSHGDVFGAAVVDGVAEDVYGGQIVLVDQHRQFDLMEL